MSKLETSGTVLMNEMQGSTLFKSVSQGVKSEIDNNPERNQVPQGPRNAAAAPIPIEPDVSLIMMEELSPSTTAPSKNRAHDHFLKKQREHLFEKMKEEVEIERAELEINRLKYEQRILSGRLSKLEETKKKRTEALELKGCVPSKQSSTSQGAASLVPENAPGKPKLIEESTAGVAVVIEAQTAEVKVIAEGRQPGKGIVTTAMECLSDFLAALGRFCWHVLGCICGTIVAMID